jgi:hypothetical protein
MGPKAASLNLITRFGAHLLAERVHCPKVSAFLRLCYRIGWLAETTTPACFATLNDRTLVGISPVLARGEAIPHGPCNCFLDDRMAQRPPVLVHVFFGLLGIVGVEGGLQPSKRGLTSDFFFNFLQDTRPPMESRDIPPGSISIPLGTTSSRRQRRNREGARQPPSRSLKGNCPRAAEKRGADGSGVVGAEPIGKS